MATREASATEETGAIPVDEGPGVAKESGRDFLRAARKDLTPEEASSPAGLRWLQYEAERLDDECQITRRQNETLRAENKMLSESHHSSLIEVEKLRGAGRVSIRNEILSTLCIGGGGAGLGVMPSYLSVSGAASLAETGMVISGVLFIGGIILRMWK